ncbi:hypothetical protein RJT34_19806 [Clitoria ternatea]|uniref:Uncharacterized protein n=1 Tax=Clitoria ternatea TaxID=43366 RepID=A0AAN9P420_CLITE
MYVIASRAISTVFKGAKSKSEQRIVADDEEKRNSRVGFKESEGEVIMNLFRISIENRRSLSRSSVSVGLIFCHVR